jgi:hypothetical protein
MCMQTIGLSSSAASGVNELAGVIVAIPHALFYRSDKLKAMLDLFLLRCSIIYYYKTNLIKLFKYIYIMIIVMYILL